MFFASMKQVAHCLRLSSFSPQPITNFQVDSRKIEPGGLFFALKGEKSDGHQFLRQARARGAIGAVVSKEYQGEGFGLELLAVDDVLASLHLLAKEAARQSKAKIVAITGSVGKTTTKEFVVSLLQAKFVVGKTEGNENTKLTLPLTVLHRKEEEEVWILEMGMSEPQDLTTLVTIAPPDIAVLTSVGFSHATFFPEGLPAIAHAKAEIFTHPKTSTAIVYEEFFKEYPEAARKIFAPKVTFSLQNRSADYFFHESVIDEKGIRAWTVNLPFQEAHFHHNFLAAVAVARTLEMKWEEIEPQIPKLKLPKMRLESFEKKGILFINDAYNASPESMRAALMAFREKKTKGQKIALLGSMLELGSFSQSLHEEIGRFAKESVDRLFVYGEEAKPLYEAFSQDKKTGHYCTTLQEAAKRLSEILHPGDLLLVKGSRSLGLEKIFDLIDVEYAAALT